MAIPSVLIWPIERLEEAMRGLMAHTGYTAALPASLDFPADAYFKERLTRITAVFSVETVEIAVPVPDIKATLRRAGPMLLQLPNTTNYIVLLSGGTFSVTLLSSIGSPQSLYLDSVKNALTEDIQREEEARVQEMFAIVGAAGHIQPQALEALTTERLIDRSVAMWILRPAPGSSVWEQSRREHLPLLLGMMIGAYLLSQLILIFAWVVLGRAVLAGHIDDSVMNTWALLLISFVPLRMIEIWALKRISMDTGKQLREWIFYGLIHLSRKDIKYCGLGQFHGMTEEAEAIASGVEHLFSLLTVGPQLAIGAAILAMGGNGLSLLLVLVLWLGVLSFIVVKAWHKTQQWMQANHAVTTYAIEEIIGHQTRLIQETPHRHHHVEDLLLKDYLEHSQAMETLGLVLRVVLHRGWLIISMAFLLPSFLKNLQTTPELVASIGGVLLIWQGLKQISENILHIIEIAASFEFNAPILLAAQQTTQKRAKEPARPLILPDQDRPVIAFDALTFRHNAHGPPSLETTSARIFMGDHILLEGNSGSGKSTLTAVLAGLVQPESGQLQLCGVPREAIPDHLWRGRVVLVPPFHENHVFTQTFLFNLLMGSVWPPTKESIKKAKAMTEAIGLGDLIARMPLGMYQMVGDGGWQLSHGERCRLYIARALLQDADLVIVDEGFEALDPETLQRVYHCIVTHTKTLLVVAHP